jgi:hypothetical protein
MRRFSAVVVFSVMLQAVVPASAYAWWEWIEQFSGAGPFTGISIEARFVCFVAVPGQAVQARPVSGLELVAGSCKLRSDEVRRASIDLGIRFVSADDDPRFANGEPIKLTTLAPSMSWNLIPSKRWDFVDYGVGAGVYWFTSTEFPVMRGAFIEPIRIDFHATTAFKERTKWSAVVPRVRVALLGFPAGFEPTAWAPAPGVARRYSRDWVKNIAIFADLEPLLRLVP